MTDNNFNLPESKKGPLANMPPLVFIFFSLSAVFILYQIVGGTISYFVLGSEMDINADNINLMRLILTFGQFMFILFPAVIFVMLQDNNLKQTFRLTKPKMSVFMLAVIGILVIQPFLQVYLYYQNELIFNLPFGGDAIKQMKELFDTMESATAKLVSANSIPELIVIVIVIAVTPAICEEFLFRGLVFKNFEKILPAGKAIFFTGFLFALFHFHPFNLVPLTVLGIFLTFIVYHSGSIYTAVFCHFVNNFLSALAVYIFGKDTFDASAATDMSGSEQVQFLILGIISLAVFIFITVMIRKNSVINIPMNNLPPQANE